MYNTICICVYKIYRKAPLKQPFYIAEALDIFLRIASPALMTCYPNHYLKVLHTIHKHIVPTLYDYNNRKYTNSIERLTGFLDTALSHKSGSKPMFLPMIATKT